MKKLFLLLALLGMITVSCEELNPGDEPGNGTEQPGNGNNDDNDDDGGGNGGDDNDDDSGNGGNGNGGDDNDNEGGNGGNGGDDNGNNGDDGSGVVFTVEGSSNIVVGAEGGDVEVVISTNIEYSVDISNATWIRHADTRATTNYTLVFNVAKNESDKDRNANIRFMDNDGVVLKTITVKQKGVQESTNLEDPVEDNAQDWD